MSRQRLSALDASFLAVESPSAHMHVGWAATFAARRARPAAQLRRAVRRTSRAGSAARRATASGSRPTRSACTRRCGSTPRTSIPPSTSTTPPPSGSRTSPTPCCRSRCARDRPLWEFWIAPELADGRIGLVGKAHHCMVDGIAAVELGTLLLDLEPERRAPDERTSWRARARRRTRSSCWPAARRRPRARAARPAARAARARARRRSRCPASRSATGRALAGAVLPVAPAERCSTGPSSPDRHLATARAPARRAARDHEPTTA